MSLPRKGQNYRIAIGGVVVAEETSCQVTRGVDTEDAQNKDLAPDSTSGAIGGANPIAVYKNMTIQVEAQGEGAKSLFSAAFALMDGTGGTVGYSPTHSTQADTENRTPDSAWSTVTAICSDLSITAPNRQPITCTAQFTVIPTPAASNLNVQTRGAGEVGEGGGETKSGGLRANDPYSVLRGEFLRIFLSGSVIALATTCTLHLSLSMEDSTTKDDTSSSSLDYKSQTPTILNYDLSSECLYGGGLAGLTEGAIVEWALSAASGDNQGTEGDPLASGSAMVTSIVLNAPVNQNITYSATFTGVGTITA